MSTASGSRTLWRVTENNVLVVGSFPTRRDEDWEPVLPVLRTHRASARADRRSWRAGDGGAGAKKPASHESGRTTQVARSCMDA